jgi:coenzyme F420-reducing hydrogenase alpha subunit
MNVDLEVDLHHLPRVEGHGNIRIRIEGGKLREARWEVVETPRYFEVMLKGKHFTTAAHLAARICGICSIGHALASLRATEGAFGVTVPETARKLRLLAKHGETLQSHYLHLFFLVLPDLLGTDSVLPLVETKPQLFDVARRLRGVANRLCEAVAGRAIHPVSLRPGGVARAPNAEQLRAARHDLEQSLEDLDAVVKLFGSLELPAFERETEFVSLEGEDAYPFIGGALISSDGVEKAERDYRAMTNEYAVEGNTSKWCRLSRESFAVGALARFNNNHRLLHDRAREVASELGLEPVCHDPFKNNVAQTVECVHATVDAIAIIDGLATEGMGELSTPVEPRAGVGVGAVEVPRGILYHEYEYDEDGYVVRADCVIPTTQNNANIQHDLVELAQRFAKAGKTDRELELLAAMLVRAYDPCISCSVH